MKSTQFTSRTTHKVLWSKTTSSIVTAVIGFCMTNRPNMGGVIQSNLILHSANKYPNADVGIILVESPNTKILDNKIYLEHSYNNAIEY